MRLDRFYLVVGDADLLCRLVPLGVRLVQLRVKSSDTRELARQIALSKAVCAKYGAQLVVNDHWELALAAGCSAVHLGQEDMATADLGALRRAGIAFGLSTHDENELERALAEEPAYVALGPIWPTALKVMKWGPQGLHRVKEWKRQVGSVPLVGIGGVTPERLPDLFAAGADSAAVVTDIATAADPEGRCRIWLAATRGKGP